MAFLYKTVNYTTAATQPSINTDPSIAPFQASVVCTVLGGATISYKVQYSLDPPDGANGGVSDANAIWNDSTGIPASTSTSASTTFFGPINRFRVVIASISGSGGSLQVQYAQGI